jgi:transcriptional regulator with XRE-family HTH domain
MRIGEKIRVLRDANGMTQTQLAELLGVAQVTLSQYERGTRPVPGDDLPRIAAALGITVNQFWEDEPWRAIEVAHSRYRAALREVAVSLRGPHASPAPEPHVPAPAPEHVDKPRPRKAHASQFWGELAYPGDAVPLAAGAR